MTATARIAPLCESVQVQLPLDAPALEIADRVSKALEASGDLLVAHAFLAGVEECQTDAEVLELARVTVTVL